MLGETARVAALEFDAISEGMARSFALTVSSDHVDRFAELSGDVSPLHVSDEFAAGRGFRTRVVHGAFLTALVSRLVGTQLPGMNAIVHQAQLTFHKPTYVGDTVTVAGRVERKLEPLRAILVSVNIDSSDPNGEYRRVASGKVQVGFTA